ncbi:hypothetical protein [Burkholderia pseudomallei]|uniref:hypothetical protein n=1 Tax=Burkholderia pseudomallei TaxID=28450 RepID=UPI00217F2893|nr:hypothetical protein [Burkholderia pseudomallei]
MRIGVGHAREARARGRIEHVEPARRMRGAHRAVDEDAEFAFGERAHRVGHGDEVGLCHVRLVLGLDHSARAGRWRRGPLASM